MPAPVLENGHRNEDMYQDARSVEFLVAFRRPGQD